jgi:hypothetical protein
MRANANGVLQRNSFAVAQAVFDFAILHVHFETSFLI